MSFGTTPKPCEWCGRVEELNSVDVRERSLHPLGIETETQYVREHLCCSCSIRIEMGIERLIERLAEGECVEAIIGSQLDEFERTKTP
jgi:hypothetical protein